MNLSEVTILITSFLRPGYLSACLDGIKRNLAECKVIVIDDGGMTGEGIISLPFDSGLSAKRNAGVKATTTPYLLMGTDDFDFSTREAREGIERMLHVLKTNPDIDIAGGRYNGQAYEGYLSVAPGQYIAQSRVPISPTGITKCDLIVNYFMARTESILPYPWDERMKIGGEHGDWFLTLKDAGLHVVLVSGVHIRTQPVNPAHEDRRYGSFRNRAKNLGHRIFLKKRGVSEFIGFDEKPPEPLKLPKFLVAVVACHKNQHKVNALRSTWLPSLYRIDYKVFYGRGAARQPASDEVFLNVDDGYLALPAKMKAIYQWALDQGYEYIYKVDDDVFVNVPRLIPCGWEKYDYSGRINRGGPIPWASGACYWLSKRAMQIVANEPLGKDTAEDRWVGTTLHKHQITLHDEPRYGLVVYLNRPPAWQTDISACLCTDKVTIEQLDAGFDENHSSAFTAPPVQQPKPFLPPPPSPDNTPTSTPGAPIWTPPPPIENWQEGFLEKKVHALFQKFRYVVATEPRSDHYKSLCRIYPEHLEETIETPRGTKIIFIVEKAPGPGN